MGSLTTTDMLLTLSSAGSCGLKSYLVLDGACLPHIPQWGPRAARAVPEAICTSLLFIQYFLRTYHVPGPEQRAGFESDLGQIFYPVPALVSVYLAIATALGGRHSVGWGRGRSPHSTNRGQRTEVSMSQGLESSIRGHTQGAWPTPS